MSTPSVLSRKFVLISPRHLRFWQERTTQAQP